jgi:hypothetical protein
MRKFTTGLVGLSLLVAGASAQAADFDITAVGETSYNISFLLPERGAAFDSPTAGFHRQSSTFNLNRFEVELSAQATDWARFQLDLATGQDVGLIDATKGGNSVFAADEVGIAQAYAELKAPVGNGLTFTIGHFDTILGMEVTEAARNHNNTRSLLYSFGAPFAHTGVLMSYEFNEWATGHLGVVNGHDTIIDSNKIPSALWGLDFNVIPDVLKWNIRGSFGFDNDFLTATPALLDERVWLMLVNNQLLWTPNEQFSLGWDTLFAFARGAPTIEYWTTSLVLAYDFNDMFTGALRAEMFDDNAGFRLGTANQEYYAGTLTGSVHLAEGVDIRPEVRFDYSDKNAFAKRNVVASKKFDIRAGVSLVWDF